MAHATWKGKTIAECDTVELVEGNIYFPTSALNMMFFKESTHTTVCGWKGVAHYYDVIVDGETNPNAAWYYPTPKVAASNIKSYVAFWKGVTVKQ